MLTVNCGLTNDIVSQLRSITDEKRLIHSLAEKWNDGKALPSDEEVRTLRAMGEKADKAKEVVKLISFVLFEKLMLEDLPVVDSDKILKIILSVDAVAQDSLLMIKP